MTALLPDLPNPQSHDQPPGPTPWSNWVIPGQSGGKAKQQQGSIWEQANLSALGQLVSSGQGYTEMLGSCVTI